MARAPRAGAARDAGDGVAAGEYPQGIPFKPDDFFVYDWRVAVGGVGRCSSQVGACGDIGSLGSSLSYRID